VLFALLLYLVSHDRFQVRRQEILDVLWPQIPAARARHRLRQALYQLKSLGVALVVDDSTVSLRAERVELDYTGLTGKRLGRTRPEFIERYTHFLPGYLPTLSNRLTAWLELERERVHCIVQSWLLRELIEHQAAGNLDEVVSCSRACLKLDPLNVRATLALANALAGLGRRSDALRAIELRRVEDDHHDHETTRALSSLQRKLEQLERDAKRSIPPIVGRVAILHELRAWLSKPHESLRIIALLGEPGIGKTRILQEARIFGQINGIRCIEYRPSVSGSRRSLAGLFDLLPDLLRLPGAIGCEPDSYSRLRELTHEAPATGSVVEEKAMFGLAEIRHATLDLFDALVVEGPILLIIDDTQDLDSQTLNILSDAAHRSNARLRLVIAARPGCDILSLLHARTDARVIRVPTLSLEESRALFAHQLPEAVAVSRPELVDLAIELASGNPFFLVELAAHCRSDDLPSALPHSVQAALGRRIEWLSNEACLLLRSCAILRNHATLGRLESVLEFAPYVMANSLAELENAGLVIVRERRVACRHDLIAETVFRGIPNALGTYLHRRSAMVLDEDLQRTPSGSLAWDCAEHWDAAGEPARAFKVSQIIVDNLLRIGLPQEAADLCARSERYCDTPEQSAERLLRLSRANRFLHNWDGVIDALERRKAILLPAASKGFASYEDEVSILEARWWKSLDPNLVRPTLERVLDNRAPTQHRLQMAVLGLSVADNYSLTSEARTIAEVVEGITTHTARELVEKSKAELIYHSSFGDLDRAVEAGYRLFEAESRGGNLIGILRAQRWLSSPLSRVGKRDEAVNVLADAYQRALRLDLRAEMWNAASNMTGMGLALDDVTLIAEWEPVLSRLADDHIARSLVLPDLCCTRARLELLHGRFDSARAVLAQSPDVQEAIPGSRGEQAALALRVMLGVQPGGTPVTRADVDRLRGLHMQSRDSGTIDFETAALLAGLIHLGDLSEAREINQYYMRVRRCRFAPRETLSRVQSALAAATR
jgi:DNA-binding SARP family transcriptional activator